MPRLFTGLELPETVVAQMALARGGLFGARWLAPEDYHITLRFVGDVDARTAHDIAETLGEIRRPPAAVRFEGLGWFGGDKPRAIVARVQPEPALIELQAEQERRLRQRRSGAGDAQVHAARDAGAPAPASVLLRSPTISARAARWRSRPSPPRGSSSIPPARARAADLTSLRRPIP